MEYIDSFRLLQQCSDFFYIVTISRNPFAVVVGAINLTVSSAVYSFDFHSGECFKNTRPNNQHLVHLSASY
ncbi:MAG: hypothetical protein ACI8VW_001709 [bacterium]